MQYWCGVVLFKFRAKWKRHIIFFNGQFILNAARESIFRVEKCYRTLMCLSWLEGEKKYPQTRLNYFTIDHPTEKALNWEKIVTMRVHWEEDDHYAIFSMRAFLNSSDWIAYEKCQVWSQAYDDNKVHFHKFYKLTL